MDLKNNDQSFKTINFHQGVTEYGSREIYLSIISKFINMTFEKQLKEMYNGMQLMDQKRIEKACFVLKGSVGQILAFEYLQKTNALYEIVKRNELRDQDLIDVYHRYFDIIDESVELANDLQRACQLQLNVQEILGYKDAIWPSYLQFMQTYITKYQKPQKNQNVCQQCPECSLM